MATASPVQKDSLRTLPSDAARQVQWGLQTGLIFRCWCRQRPRSHAAREK